MLYVLVAGLVLGPLLLARVRHFGPSPRGIEVRPDAPKLNMAIVVDSSEDNPAVKPLIASLNGMRPQPAHIVIEPGATAPEGVDYVIEMAPEVVFATPEACDRIAHALDANPSIAVYPWVKTSKPKDALRLFPTVLDALSSGAFAVVPLGSKWRPTTMLAYKPGSENAKPTIYGGGHVVAQPVGPRSAGAPNVLTTILAVVYLVLALGAGTNLVLDFGLGSFVLYAGYVFSLSICLKQIAKFPRASALVYPFVLIAGAGYDFQGRVMNPKPAVPGSM